LHIAAYHGIRNTQHESFVTTLVMLALHSTLV